jgi:acyl carrier protein
MSEGTVAERVIRVFADFKKVSPDEIKPETTFDDLGLDSLDGMNLVFELEEEFDIMIPDDRVRSMKSVHEAIEGIEYLLEHPDEQHAVTPAAPPKNP